MKENYKTYVYPVYGKIKYKLKYDEEKFFVNKSDPIIFFGLLDFLEFPNYGSEDQAIYLFSENPRDNKKFENYRMIFNSKWDHRRNR